MHRTIIAALVAAATVTPAFADGFERITERDEFVDLIRNRPLTRFAIKVQVLTDGGIVGRAYSFDVSGDWFWQDGFFCRDLYLSGDELDMNNCQVVEVSGDTMRFTSDRGTGDSADLTLN